MADIYSTQQHPDRENKEPTRGKGECPHCGGLAPIAPDGLLIFHGDRNTFQGDCLGSREQPV